MGSLRGRLTLGVLVVLAVVLGVSGTAVSRYVERSERDALDDRLQRTAELSRATALTAVQQQLPTADDRLEAVLSATRTSLRLLLGRTVLLETGSTPRPHEARPGMRTLTLDGERYRSYAIELRDAGLGGLVKLEVMTALGPLESRLERLDRRLAYGGLAALLVAGLGTWFAADLALRPLRRLRRMTGTIAADQDLTRRVSADEGPAEIRSVARSFNAMLARLSRSAADRERALEATRRFAADAGHELRTPLTSMQATLSTIARHPDLEPDRRTAMAADALAEQQRLVDLLDGLQALARGDAAPGDGADVDLAEVVADVVADAAARHPGTELVADVPDGAILVLGWDAGLRVLIANLVANAVLHGRDDGRVQVTLAGGTSPRLTVDDDGRGVPDEARARIFEPFTRLDTAKRPGSGLGLALVAQQARHHGATVTVDDSPSGGARFVVTFVAQPARPPG